jgi:hypothetical protein
MAKIIIYSNDLQDTNVLIKDVGVVIPPYGGFDDLTGFADQLIASDDLKDLVSDDKFGTDGSTLIVRTDVGGSEVDSAALAPYLTGFVVNIGTPPGLGDILTTVQADVVVGNNGDLILRG